MVSWFWIPLALSGGFVLGIIVLGVLSSSREEDAYRDGFGDGYGEGFGDGYGEGFKDGSRNTDVGPGGKQDES